MKDTKTVETGKQTKEQEKKKKNIEKIESDAMKNKVKILKIINILKEHSDKDNHLTLLEILDHFNAKEDKAERIKKKDTVSSFMNALTTYYCEGNDGEYTIIDSTYSDFENDDVEIYDQAIDGKSPIKKYYLQNNELEFYMLLPLYYEVLQSKSIDKETAKKIATKLEKMMNRFERKKLREPLAEDGLAEIKGIESAKNVVKIKEAFDLNKALSFDYCSYNLNKELVKKSPDVPYEVAPLKFIHSSGKNYLIGYHLQIKQERTYRIDKMVNISVIDNPMAQDKNICKPTVKKNLVFMHSDKILERVELKCEMRILDNVIEQFKDCYLRKHEDSKYFYATLKNVTDIGVRYWILQFSSACEVLSPKSLRDDVKETLSRALSWYEA